MREEFLTPERVVAARAAIREWGHRPPSAPDVRPPEWLIEKFDCSLDQATWLETAAHDILDDGPVPEYFRYDGVVVGVRTLIVFELFAGHVIHTESDGPGSRPRTIRELRDRLDQVHCSGLRLTEANPGEPVTFILQKWGPATREDHQEYITQSTAAAARAKTAPPRYPDPPRRRRADHLRLVTSDRCMTRP